MTTITSPAPHQAARRWHRALCSAAAVSLAGACGIQAALSADAYPSRPIQMVIPFPAGGPADIVGRLYAQHLATLLGQPVTTLNRDGAAGTIGTDAVARATPDGYTIVFGTTSTMAVNQVTMKNLPYDFMRDFSLIGLIANAPHILAVRDGLPVKSATELIALAKRNPGKYTFASAGTGTIVQMAGELFRVEAGIDLLHVPYKGGGPAVADLIGGQVKVFFNTPGLMWPHVTSGRLRALAVTSAQRMEFAPDLPTVAESGVPGFEASIWYGIYGPKNLPAALTQRWNNAVNRYVKSPQAQEYYRRAYMSVVGGTPASFASFHELETARWGAIVASSGIKPQ